MKATDFRREHFARGRSFSQADFDAYTDASARFARAVLTGYLPCVGGGLALGVILSSVVGGFAGNMLALLFIFGGLIAGAVVNMRASRPVKDCADRLGLTREEIREARKNVKNGTYAWTDGVPSAAPAASAPAAPMASAPEAPVFCPHCGAPLRPGARFCTACGKSMPEEPAAPAASAPAVSVTNAPEPAAVLRGEHPMCGVWAGALLVVLFFALALLYSPLASHFRMLGATPFLVAVALMGAAAYLISRRKVKYLLWGLGAGVFAILLQALSYSVASAPLFMETGLPLRQILGFENGFFRHNFLRALVPMLPALLGATAVSLFVRKGDKKQRARLSGGAAAVAFFLAATVRMCVTLVKGAGFSVAGALFENLCDAGCIYLICMAVYAVCTMPSARVRLRGIGLVWAWIAVFGMAAGLVSVIASGVNRDTANATISALLMPAIGMVGYILLLSKRRVGLYVILIGCGLMLGAQAEYAIEGMFFEPRAYGMRAASALIAGINPLFAWLAVRAGTVAPKAAAPMAASAPVSAQKPASVFQKIAAWLCLAAGVAGVAFPIASAIQDGRFQGGMAIYIAFSLLLVALGVVLLVKQRARKYGKGARVFGAIGFGFGLIFLIVSIVGIITDVIL